MTQPRRQQDGDLGQPRRHAPERPSRSSSRSAGVFVSVFIGLLVWGWAFGRQANLGFVGNADGDACARLALTPS